MSTGTLIFLFLFVGGGLAMFSMHRGGHAHGGTAGGGGGCCGGGAGHNHGGSHEEEQTPDTSGGREIKPLLGPPGTQSGTPVAAPAETHKHRGC